MNSLKHPHILQISLLFFLLTLHYVNTVIVNNHKLVYTQCANHTSPNPSHSELLSALFQEFIARSSKSRFVETIVADDKTAISGTFQCRNDLSPDECKNCARKFPILSKDSCGENVPARIQLSGCYAHYQEENGAEINSRPDKLLHRACSKHKIKKNGFVEMKYAAFSALESGVISGNGFCNTMYESIRVVAQCVGFLGACDCGECVNSAVEIAGEDGCRFSVSGEVYLDSCFVSYDYDRNRGFGGYFDEDNGKGDRSPKLVAIVVGGLALLSFGLAFCYFLSSCGKKKEDW